ncbi:hypothetical protein V501_03799, partial [Pseudogymnoascus sp. VKM F-4519 (FW-2642)]
MADDVVRKAIGDIADSTMAQTARLVAIYAEQRSAGHHPVIPAVDHTPQFSGAVPPRVIYNELPSNQQPGKGQMANRMQGEVSQSHSLPTWDCHSPNRCQAHNKTGGPVSMEAALFNKQLSKHSTGAYIDLCNGVGVHFKAVLGKGAADYGQETQLVATSTAFDAPEKSREHPSSDAIAFQLSAKEWRERFNAEVAIKEALEIEMIGIKGENAELLTEMKALREEEATRI